MDKFEMIQKLSEKANVSYDEAKDALEACDWDILDAMMLLENQGKAKEEQPSEEYSTQKKKEYNWNTKHIDLKCEISKGSGKFWEWLKKMFHKGNTNQFVITRKGEELISMPITVLVLLLICFWPFSLIMLFLGLFLKARYSFVGPDIAGKVNDVINAAQEKAASAVQAHRRSSDDE